MNAELKAAEMREWPADKVSRRPIAVLVPYARNARTHSPEQVAQIAASIREWGWTMPILIDEEGGIIAGHGRVMAAQKLGIEDAPCMVAEGWSEAQKRAYTLADNKLALNAGWDEGLLALEAADLPGAYAELAGFSIDELTSFSLAPENGEGQGQASDGSLLKLLDVTIAEPRHVVETGDIWDVGHHVLLCCSVMYDWSQWSRLLNGENAVFAPYPSPFMPLSEKAADHRLVMVQPDTYIAGHLLDRYADVKGEVGIKKRKRE